MLLNLCTRITLHITLHTNHSHWLKISYQLKIHDYLCAAIVSMKHACIILEFSRNLRNDFLTPVPLHFYD